MARRNPTNERYMNQKPAGTTRKSAAAAKPKRSAGASSGSKTKAPAGRAASANAMLHPPTPEYKQLRKIWYVLLGVSMVFATVSWWLWRTNQTLGLVGMVVGWVILGAAVWIDYSKMRPLRIKYARSGGSTTPEAKAEKTDAKSDTDES